MTAILPDRPSGRSVSTAWLVGLALSLTSDDGDDELAVRQLVTESGESPRALEGAYGRAVALVAEYPDDPALRTTLALLARALQQVLREGEARL